MGDNQPVGKADREYEDLAVPLAGADLVGELLLANLKLAHPGNAFHALLPVLLREGRQPVGNRTVVKLGAREGEGIVLAGAEVEAWGSRSS